MVDGDCPPSEARGRLWHPDQEIGERPNLLSYEIFRRPLWPGRAHRPFYLCADLRCHGSVVFLRRGDACRQGEVEALVVLLVSCRRHRCGAAFHDGPAQALQGLA